MTNIEAMVNELVMSSKRNINDLQAEEKCILHEENANFKKLMLMHIDAEKQVYDYYARKIERLNELVHDIIKMHNNHLSKIMLESFDDMIYTKTDSSKLLLKGTLFGRKFAVITQYGCYPSAYLQLFESDTTTVVEDIERAHGEGTYLGEAYWDDADTDKYVGWDYVYKGDHIPQPTDVGMIQFWLSSHIIKQWTVAEIYEDLVYAIVELRQRNEELEEDLK